MDSWDYDIPYDGVQARNGGSWFSNTDLMTKLMGFSFLSSFLGMGAGDGMAGGAGNAAFVNSIRLLVLGALLEGGRRLFRYVSQRFKLFRELRHGDDLERAVATFAQERCWKDDERGCWTRSVAIVLKREAQHFFLRAEYSIDALFTEGDPAYEWLILLLTEEKVWSRSREFRVTASSSARKWNVNVNDTDATVGRAGHVDYVPTYQEAQLFKWRGYWVEIRRNKGQLTYNPAMGQQVVSSMYLTIYTRDMSVLSALVDDARERYLKSNKPHVIVFSADQPNYGPGSTWSTAKRKQRRPLSSIILQDGVIQTLVEDAREFMRSEDWYTKAGIPHRRGYLLHGPPGTGKSSTIYAVAGELGLEIYTLSLSANFVDDAFLARAVASIPKQAIFLLEDIDCAFPSREEQDEEDEMPAKGPMMFPPGMVMPGGPRSRQRSPVTMSGLLNVLDGVGSEEGKLFFATTNYIDRLDPALLRPGRIDLKFEYKLATQAQAAALFLRFYPESHTVLLSEKAASSTTATSEKSPAPLSAAEKEAILSDMSKEFSAQVPEHEFSTAELQGFLLGCKQQPEKAVSGVAEWVRNERQDREDKKQREEERAAKKRDKKETQQARELQGTLAKLGSMGVNPFSGGSTAVNGAGAAQGSAKGSPGGLDAGGAVNGRSSPVGTMQTPYGMMVPPPNTAGTPLGPLAGVNGLTNGAHSRPSLPESELINDATQSKSALQVNGSGPTIDAGSANSPQILDTQDSSVILSRSQTAEMEDA
ncbi:hypothetical protein D9619_009197 [Psilocybe cf. subviscida]|uniref:AAA+ ATPase domain-containing protein n=1 Tax=Psilocybe cf. subviscida TaxID=2480587 RepID=A0A8H5BUA8_9AGAR|nr:hypothetical protein D9619_009197 [Psilocybe cf. subviscida]